MLPRLAWVRSLMPTSQPQTRRTTCEECGTRVTLDTVDADGDLIGGECSKCGYYVTRYMPGREPV